MREINIIELDISTRDKYINQVEQQILSKRKLLLDKRIELEKTIKENEYLEKVKSDYNKYYNHIVQQKQEQIKAMELINNYINDIIINGKLTDHDFEKAKKEKAQLLNEIGEIKQKLNEIVNKQPDK